MDRCERGVSPSEYRTGSYRSERSPFRSLVHLGLVVAVVLNSGGASAVAVEDPDRVESPKGVSPGVSATALPAISKLAVVFDGPMADCVQPVTSTFVRDIRAELARQLGADKVVNEAATADAIREIGRPSHEKIVQAIESAQKRYLDVTRDGEAALKDAADILSTVIQDVDRLPVGAQRWADSIEARAQAARVAQMRGDKARATELFLQILRVDEDVKLDGVKYPGSTRGLFDQARKLLRGLSKSKLKVSTRSSMQQPVFVNGLRMGSAGGNRIFERALVQGSYEVVVGERGLPKPIQLMGDTTLDVDVESDARALAEQGSCVTKVPGGGPERLAAFSALSLAVHADQLVMVRFERAGTDEYFVVSRLNPETGHELHDGRIRVGKGELPPTTKAVRFVVSGESAEMMQSVDEKGSGANLIVSKEVGVGLWAATAVLAVVGIVELARASSMKSDLEKLTARGGLRPEDVAQAADKEDSASRERTVGWSLIGAAVATGVSGTVIFALAPAAMNGKLAGQVLFAGRF